MLKEDVEYVTKAKGWLNNVWSEFANCKWINKAIRRWSSMHDFGLLDCLKVFHSMARWSGDKVNSFPSTDTTVDLPGRVSQSTDFGWID